MKKHTKLFLSLLLTAVMILSLAACGNSTTSSSSEAPSTPEGTPAENSGDAAQGDPITIKVGTVHYEGSVGVRALQVFEEHLETASGGRIQVEIYPGGVLGSASVMREMLFENDIQINVVNPVGYEKDIATLSVLNNYYMFDNLEHLHRFWEGEGGQLMLDSYNEIGLQGLAVMSLGLRELYNSSHPIKSMDDLKNLSIRGYSTIQIAAWESVGTTMVAVDWNELFVSLQQKLIDGEEGAITNFEDYSFYEVQKYFTMTDHVAGCDIVVCSQDWLGSLSEADQALVQEAANMLYEYHRDHYIPENEALLEKYASEYGIEVSELDPEVKAQMAEKMGATTAELIKKNCDEETFNRVMNFVEQARE